MAKQDTITEAREARAAALAKKALDERKVWTVTNASSERFEEGLMESSDDVGMIPMNDGCVLKSYRPMYGARNGAAGIIFSRPIGEGDTEPVDAIFLAPMEGARFKRSLASVPGLFLSVAKTLNGVATWRKYDSADAAETAYFEELYASEKAIGGVFAGDTAEAFKQRAAEFLAELVEEGTKIPKRLLSKAANACGYIFPKAVEPSDDQIPLGGMKAFIASLVPEVLLLPAAPVVAAPIADGYHEELNLFSSEWDAVADAPKHRRRRW